MSKKKVSLGKILLAKRQDLNLEIKQVANSLNVKESVIIKIENDDIQSVENKNLYSIGLLRAYAKFLQIDEKIVKKKINLLSDSISNTENKEHLLLNVGEDSKLSPTVDDSFNFLLISVLLFLITLTVYSLSSSKNLISIEELISKIEKIDESKH